MVISGRLIVHAPVQAELDSLVREYHGGHDQNFDKDALPWSVEQLVSIVRSALYKTAIGQDVMRLVSRWDKDGSGEVTYPQFVMALRTEVKIPKRTIPGAFPYNP